MVFGNYTIKIMGEPISLWPEHEGRPIEDASLVSVISLADIRKNLGKLKMNYSTSLRVLPERVLRREGWENLSQVYDQINPEQDVVELDRRERGFPLMLFPKDSAGNPMPTDDPTIIWFGRPGFQRMGTVRVNYVGPLAVVKYEDTISTPLQINLSKALDYNFRALGMFAPGVLNPTKAILEQRAA